MGLCREAGDRWHEAKLLSRLGYLAYTRGDLVGADRLLNQSLLLWHALEHQSGVASVLQRLAQVELMRGKVERAGDYARQSLIVYRRQGDRVGEATALQRLGAAELQMGHLDGAEEALRQSVSFLRDMESGLILAETLTSWGRLMQLQDKPQDAMRSHIEAIQIAESMRNHRMMSANLCSLASVLLGLHKHTDATKLLASAASYLHRISGPMPVSLQRQIDILKMDLLRHLSQVAYDGAWEEGQNLNLKQILEIIANAA